MRQAPWWWQDDFWRTIFRIVERHDFCAEMIRRVNEELSQRFWDARVMVRYHATLRSYAQSRSPRDPSLYQILEAKGVQYWDYWLVYPDHQARS